ncbi:B3 domain-containing protein REM20 isoform X1 [Vigna radiata var. radiata]|uniref:B3 domain-containing protein REM20 isoform X1 n=1 Tax=Vigna radiata var. radiata TaxID=3916 RepID=A0A1S3VUY6_VIGRR|nr:B3 domain-containing protein REM20 isoform X1 [Vigna radiata var. radiata]XP_022634065.1 B3 domain-containing protein REM20 isoform X1 [Vigna radiata var. radiata]XP_022634066.1 B3 domain-containing protein REM20 isoform X1 [Vigna radiata var. radiata]
MTGGERYPDFFKVFLQEQHSERMLIPNAFVKLERLQGRIPEDVLLRNSSERVWHVKTRFFGDRLYFDEGWKIFREENCLRNVDFLIFRYDGVNEFRVKILEKSTQCEKTLVKMEEEEGNEEEKAAPQEVEETVITQEEQAEDRDTEDEEDSQDQDYDDDDNDDSDFDENTEMEEQSEEEIFVGPVGYTSQSYRKTYRRDTASSSYPQTDDPFKEEEFDPETCIQPENNFFEAKLYRSRPNELHIPGIAIQDFSLSFPEKITLKCCQHCQRKDIQRNKLQDYHLNLAQETPIRKRYLEVTGKVCRWQDDRICIKGWANFSRRNKIKINDVCICEVISDEAQVVRTFLVHVIGTRRE